MTKAKTTKRALLTSVLSMMLCMAMLVGSTFAWFTDSVTSGVNKIIAGNLDIDLKYCKPEQNGTATTDWSPVEGATELFNDVANWEPGAASVVYLEIKNLGNLALRYQLAIKAVDVRTSEDGGKLSDVLKTAVINLGENMPETLYTRDTAIAAANAKAESLADYKFEDHMTEKGATRYLALIIYFPSEVENTYVKDGVTYTINSKSHPEIDLGISLAATQYASESDSFNPNYDANATLKNEIVKYAFENASDADAFCPECADPVITTDHTEHDTYLIIEDGVAKLARNAAHLNFKELDWDKNTYVMDYDVDLSNLDDNAFIAFDAGERTNWLDLQLGFKKTEAGIDLYNTLYTNQLNDGNLLGKIGEKVHITYAYATVRAGLSMIATVTDGKNTYKVEKTSRNLAETDLYWNVYTAEGDSDIYATLDNLLFSACPISNPKELYFDKDTMTLYELLPTLKKGDILVLPAGTYITTGTFTVAAGVTIKGVDGAEVIIRQNNPEQDDIFNCEGDVVIKNITFETNRKGYAVTDTTKNHDSDGDITIINCRFKGIGTDKNWGVYKNKYGNLTIKDCTFENYNNAICGVDNSGDSTTVITGCTFSNMNNEAIGYVSSTMPPDFESEVIANNTGLTEENVIGY